MNGTIRQAAQRREPGMTERIALEAARLRELGMPDQIAYDAARLRELRKRAANPQTEFARVWGREPGSVPVPSQVVDDERDVQTLRVLDTSALGDAAVEVLGRVLDAYEQALKALPK